MSNYCGFFPPENFGSLSPHYFAKCLNLNHFFRFLWSSEDWKLHNNDIQWPLVWFIYSNVDCVRRCLLLNPDFVWCYRTALSSLHICLFRRKILLFLQESQLGHLWTGLENPGDSDCLEKTNYVCELLVFCICISLCQTHSDLVLWTDKGNLRSGDL